MKQEAIRVIGSLNMKNRKKNQKKDFFNLFWFKGSAKVEKNQLQSQIRFLMSRYIF
jgi:hypothetical protein